MSGNRSTTRPLTGAEYEAAVQQAWYDLIVAEERGMDAPTLERLVARYLSTLEALVAARKGAARIRQSAA
ncbi:MAG: hypothetical protein H0X24_19440 [Ktedonobacterales bacterium]|nr:hypothetical protein [Ktedonobacterales bacterium]